MQPTSFTFGGFTLRPAGVEDLELAAAWSEADPAHRGTPAAFWIAQSMDIKSFLLLDEDGPVFFFRMKAVFGTEGHVQVYIQFPPDSTREMEERVQRGLLEGFAWLESQLLRVPFYAVYFDTKNPKLAYFCRRQLGFMNTGRKNQQGGMILKRRLEAKAA
jgi:hypothetical protein